MNIMEVYFDTWRTITFSFNWIAILILIAGVGVLIYLVKKIMPLLGRNSLRIDEATLGIGDSSITIKFDKRDQEVAYKLWVELSTRKIGLLFEEDNDVIDEVYNSWYAFFGIARELLKEIPAEKLSNSGELVNLTQRVLNEGLRPHLTKWQAKYRKWYAGEKDREGAPQEIQKNFPEYEALLSDLKETNKRMIEYKEYMRKIAFKDK